MTDFKAKMHQIRFPCWGSLQHSPRPPSWIWGPLCGRGRGWAGEEEGKGRGGREGKRGPKLLLNQGPSEPCYATVHKFSLSLRLMAFFQVDLS